MRGMFAEPSSHGDGALVMGGCVSLAVPASACHCRMQAHSLLFNPGSPGPAFTRPAKSASSGGGMGEPPRAMR
jgi:hypothetical protein